MSKSIQKTEFKNFVKDIKEKILLSQYEALKSVNKELIGLYWNKEDENMEESKI